MERWRFWIALNEMRNLVLSIIGKGSMAIMMNLIMWRN